MKTFEEHLHEANTTAVLIAVAKEPKVNRGYWRIGNEVYSASARIGMDAYGHPMDKRWEASYDHFTRFWEPVYSTFFKKTSDWK